MIDVSSRNSPTLPIESLRPCPLQFPTKAEVLKLRSPDELEELEEEEVEEEEVEEEEKEVVEVVVEVEVERGWLC
jgi:hypothetical protein